MKKWMGLVLMGLLGAQGVMGAPEWLTSLPEAQAKAQKEGKLVFMDFTGSDWCEPCQRLEADIFSKPEFADYAAKNLELVRVDFPAKNRQPKALRDANDALQTKYDPDGIYPMLVALKPDGKVVWKCEGAPNHAQEIFSGLDEARKK